MQLLSDAIAMFKLKLQAGERIDCPCCGRYAQIYSRRIHSIVAKQLIEFYKLGGASRYVHLSELSDKFLQSAGDFTKAKYWNLIEEKKQETDDKKRSGFWKLTEEGVLFVLGHKEIPEFIDVYDDEIIKRHGRLVRIYTCLGTKFNYHELMQGKAGANV